MPLEGKIAEVLDTYRVVVNIGGDDGVKEGMEFEIFEQKGGYTDPDTGEDLGTREVVKARVEVVELYDKMSVMESAETERHSPLTDAVRMYTSSQRTKQLPTESNVETDERTVERGDQVREINESGDDVSEDVEE